MANRTDKVVLMEEIIEDLKDTAQPNVSYHFRVLKDSFKRPISKDGKSLSLFGWRVFQEIYEPGRTYDMVMIDLLNRLRDHKSQRGCIDLLDYLLDPKK